jgi:hypothetical protein
MKFRKLRIAWSVMCGMLCVLLIALWVRSYSWTDAIQYNPVERYVTGLTSRQGVVFGGWFRFTDMEDVEELFRSSRWNFVCRPSEPLPPKYSRWGVGLEESGHFAPYITTPHWFVVALLAASTAIPWLRWRFSLRTLLIAMTLVAVVLGLVVWASRGG